MSLLESAAKKDSKNQFNDTLQMELHYRSTKDVCRFTILLNNMRLMGIFDWLLAVYDFLTTGSVDPYSHDDGRKRSEGEKQRKAAGLSKASLPSGRSIAYMDDHFTSSFVLSFVQ